MENLKKAILNVLSTLAKVASAYEDKKIVWNEWAKIGLSAISWVWIFKHIPEIKADIEGLNEEGVNEIMAEVKANFDIPQDQLEVIVEEVLNYLLLLVTMIEKQGVKLNK